MKRHEFTKTRVIFPLGLILTASALLYTFRSSDKLQAMALVILGLVITSGALLYVLVKSVRQTPKLNITNDSAAPGSIIFAELTESLAFLFFIH